MGLSKFQIELLRKIPREPEKFISMNDMAGKLHENWGNSKSLESKRKKISNNLNKIDEIYPNCIDRNTKSKEHLFRMKASAPMLLTPMSQEQMMAFGLLRKFGTDLLSGQAHRALSPFFEAAQHSAIGLARDAGVGARASQDLGRQWLDKIAVVPAVLPFCAPVVDEKIKQTVEEALLLEQRLKLQIVHSNAQKNEETCEVSPLALVQQGVRTYLIGQKQGKRTVDRFLLARILKAEHTYEKAEVPPGWCLKKFLEQGIGHPVFAPEQYGQLEQIELWVDAGSQWIKETPLAPDPVIEPLSDGSYIMKVEMPITEELVHWLLSMAFHVRVNKPEFLVARMKQDLAKSVALYG